MGKHRVSSPVKWFAISTLWLAFPQRNPSLWGCLGVTESIKTPTSHNKVQESFVGTRRKWKSFLPLGQNVSGWRYFNCNREWHKNRIGNSISSRPSRDSAGLAAKAVKGRLEQRIGSFCVWIRMWMWVVTTAMCIQWWFGRCLFPTGCENFGCLISSGKAQVLLKWVIGVGINWRVIPCNYYQNN